MAPVNEERIASLNSIDRSVEGIVREIHALCDKVAALVETLERIWEIEEKGDNVS